MGIPNKCVILYLNKKFAKLLEKCVFKVMPLKKVTTLKKTIIKKVRNST